MGRLPIFLAVLHCLKLHLKTIQTIKTLKHLDNMSTNEIQNLVFQQGQFTFSDGHKNDGMIVVRYNIVDARIEYYLIPEQNILAYQAAKSHAEPNAHKTLGMNINIDEIIQVKLAA